MYSFIILLVKIILIVLLVYMLFLLLRERKKYNHFLIEYVEKYSVLFEKIKANKNFKYTKRQSYRGPYDSDLYIEETDLPIYLYNRNWIEQRTSLSLSKQNKDVIRDYTTRRVNMLLVCTGVIESLDGIKFVLSDLYDSVITDPLPGITRKGASKKVGYLLECDIEFHKAMDKVRCHSIKLTPFTSSAYNTRIAYKLLKRERKQCFKYN